MKNYLIGFLALTLIASAFLLHKTNKKLSLTENNQEVLLDSIKNYKIADSLNAASINALQLSIKQLNKYRTEDISIIKKLKVSNSELQQYITTQLESQKSITTRVHDTIIIYARDTIQIAKAFDYKSKWADVNGYLLNDSLRINISNRESLLISQSKVKKKFWFIKLPIWLFGYKTEKIDVVSKNPNTVIQSIEFVKKQ